MDGPSGLRATLGVELRPLPPASPDASGGPLRATDGSQNPCTCSPFCRCEDLWVCPGPYPAPRRLRNQPLLGPWVAVTLGKLLNSL